MLSNELKRFPCTNENNVNLNFISYANLKPCSCALIKISFLKYIGRKCSPIFSAVFLSERLKPK